MKRLLALGAVLSLTLACNRIDPTRPRPYRCDPGQADAQCPGGWHCGLSGFCRDPAIGAPDPCLVDTDCGGGWHCGVDQVCYDLQDAGAVACRPDGGDCASGWRCGLSGFCHSEAVAAPYACATDDDCERGWRCGPSALCLDTSPEGLRPEKLPPGQWTRVPTPNPLGSPPQTVLGTVATGATVVLPQQETQITCYGGGFVFTYRMMLTSNVSATFDPVALAWMDAGAQDGCARVDGAPGLSVACDEGIACGDTPPLRIVAWDAGVYGQGGAGFQLDQDLQLFGTELRPPISAQAVQVGDSKEVLVAMEDRVWAAPVEAILSAPADGDAGFQVPLSFSPLPRLQIQSLAASPVDAGAGGPLLAGYLLIQERLFSFQTADFTGWQYQELLLPPGAPLSVWTDGARGRVGFSDGTVYSLPSRVVIGSPLPNDSVVEYASLCGDAYALGNAGAYQLAGNPDGGPIGVWLPFALPMPDGGWAGGRLFSTGDELFAFSAGTEAYLLTPDGGCAAMH